MLVGGLISNHDAAWRWVVSLFMRALTCCVPTVEMLFEVCFYHQVQFCHAVGLDRVRASNRCCPIGLGNLMVPKKDVATMSHGHPVFRVEA